MIRIYRNNVPGAPRFLVKRLPWKQLLVWIGPWFVLIQR